MVDALAANVTSGVKARGREGVLQGGLLCPPFAFGGPRRLLLQQHVHAHGKTQYDGENKHKKQQHDALASRGGLACVHSAKGLVRFRSASTALPRLRHRVSRRRRRTWR